METYQEMKIRHQKEVNAFPIYFAFSNVQLGRMFKELGLNPQKDCDKIVSIPGTGGFILKKDTGAYKEMSQRQHEELHNAISEDVDGTGFIYQMFRYELANHEFGYTGDADDAIAALGYTEKQIEETPALKQGFEKAKQYILNNKHI